MAEEFLPVRLSHLLRHCSVGAIVRGSDSLVVVRDIRDWNPPGEQARDREIRYVDQVCSALGIGQALCKPPVKRERDGVIHGWIPARRFPSWMRCLKCGLMHRSPWRNADASEMEDLRCGGNAGDCDGRLEQSPWVLAHEEGYLADAPWHDLAHAGSRNAAQHQCRADWTSPYLKLVDTEVGRQIQCTRCGSSGGMESRWSFGAYTGQQPWIREPPTQPPKELAWLLEINDVRVHSADNRTALVIPPESRIRRGSVVDQLYGNSNDQRTLRLSNAKGGLARKSDIRQISTKYGCTPSEIEKAMAEIDGGYPLYGQAVTGQDLLVGEFVALTEPIPDLKEDEDFVTDHRTPAWEKLKRTLEEGPARRAAGTISRLIAVNKLKEIMVLTGFRRASGETVTPPDITGESDWRPAIELYGEGVFFTLDESLLRRWEDDPTVRERTLAFEQRYPSAPIRVEVNISSRFLLCHTLAHLMIRQIEATAGYPAASLKERIYCAGGAKPMAGILIYVAVADEEGSLGGLMELASPERFLRLLTAAYEAAQWCSLDPVCGEQEGHGPGLLNRAACHACALVPETSCMYENVLLDRAYITGDTGFADLLKP